MPKIISEHFELVNLCHVNCSGPVFIEKQCRGFPLGMKEVRDLAYQYSERNKLYAFRSKHGKAGYYWFTGFMHLYPKLRIRKPKALSAARAMAMNRPIIGKW